MLDAKQWDRNTSIIPAQKICFSAADREEIRKRIDHCLATGYVAQGENVKEFEQLFARNTGAKHAIALSSGGAAIEVAMHLLNLQGGEVLVPTNTFIATASGVLLAGGKVKFVDTAPESFGVSLADIKAARSSRTVGVILVHIGGIITPEIERITNYCRETGLWLFEDCAHAHGSTFNGRAAGRFGIMGAYSFFATKVITSGEGGMLVMDDDDLAAKARAFRDYGKVQQWVTFSSEIGANRRMSEFCAAVGVVHAQHLEEFVESRRQIAAKYTALLEGIEGLELVLPRSPCSWYKYIALLPGDVEREELKALMANKHVQLAGGVYDLPLHQQPVFRGTPGKFPMADDICRRHICLPIYQGMSVKEVEYVVEVLRSSIVELQQAKKTGR